MAKYVSTRLVDDLDGSDAVATVSFSLDGRDFEIDLSEAHAGELRAALEPFVAAARRVSGGDGAERTAGRSGRGVPARRRGRTDAARSVAAEPRVVTRAEVVVDGGAMRDSTPAQEPAVSTVSPSVGRTGKPLVADPFNPGVRFV